MRKRVLPRLIGFLLIGFLVFVLLAAMQFSRPGNFTQRIGDLVINVRYGQTNETIEEGGMMPLDGGASVTFGGLEFQLTSQPNRSGAMAENSFALVDSEGGRLEVVPEYLSFSDDKAIFSLPGGAELVFSSQNISRGHGDMLEILPELQISGTFPDNISAIVIPLRTQRSSMYNDDGILTVSHRGSRYRFNRPLQGLNDNRLILLASMPAISYRLVSETDARENNPADFIVQNAETPQAYADMLSQWTARNFDLWVRTMPPPGDEDQVIALSAEALRQNRFRATSELIPVSFRNGANRSWESAVYQIDDRSGVWENAVRLSGVSEREKDTRITGLIAENNYDLFRENKLIDFLAVRNQHDLIDEIMDFSQEIDSDRLTLAMSPGILENIMDSNRLRPNDENPFEPLAEQTCRLIAEGLHSSSGQSFVVSGGQVDTEFNVRLGMALDEWGSYYEQDDWAALGRSLVISALSLGDENGLVPASLRVAQNGQFTPSAENFSTARLYRMLGNNENLPRATAGLNDMWVWSAATSVNITQGNNFMDIIVRYPVGETHYMMIRNVRPFFQLNVHGIIYRSSNVFETYFDSPGWWYIDNEQTLVLKIRHRTVEERVRITINAPPPPRPAPRPVPIPMPMPVPVPAPVPQPE